MKPLLRRLLAWCWRRLQPKANPVDERDRARAELRVYQEILAAMPIEERAGFVRFSSVASEMIEARLMAGSGPGIASPGREMIRQADEAIKRIHDRALGLREAAPPVSSQGAFGDIELALSNVEWRREINLSWLEFSRWGIQQIILISRLYYIKNPLLRRAIDVCAAYVFGRGVEITASDDAANEVLQEFWERNKATLGQNALIELEKRKYYDGNLFFAFFADTDNLGTVDVRTIDATEIQDVVVDPEDGSEIMYRRVWQYSEFDPATGRSQIRAEQRWYPALGFEGFKTGTAKPAQIGGKGVEWSTPVMHRICGAVAKWSMGCPIAYPAIEWAKTSKEFLEACLTLAQSHAQIAWKISTKGGQAALQGTKQQLQTTVNAAPVNSLWDTNPPPVDGSIFASGPGTTIAPVQSRGMGLDPTEVKEFRNMVGMVFGIPPTWLGDMETANLSTATTLDRPTELGFRAKQVQWEEDFSTIAKFVIETSAGAVNGKIREALEGKARASAKVIVIDAPRKTLPNGRRVYDEAAKPKDDEIQVRVTFPAIREGDVPALIKAIAEAMTLDNKGGQIVGIDEKEGVRLLFEQLGVEDPEDILESMYPSQASGVKGKPGYKPKYDPNRTVVPLPAPIGKALPSPGGLPQLPGGKQIDTGNQPGQGPQDKPVPTATESALGRLLAAARKLRERKSA